MSQSDMISVSDIAPEADREPGVWMEGGGVGCTAISRSERKKEKASLLSERPPDCQAGSLYSTLDFSLTNQSLSLILWNPQGVHLF